MLFKLAFLVACVFILKFRAEAMTADPGRSLGNDLQVFFILNVYLTTVLRARQFLWGRLVRA